MIKFLVITFLVFLLIRLVAPFLLRWALKVFIGKQIKKGGFAGGFGGFTNARQPGGQRPHQGPFREQQPTGKITIDYIPKEDKTQNKPFLGGDYVEYEEVK